MSEASTGPRCSDREKQMAPSEIAQCPGNGPERSKLAIGQWPKRPKLAEIGQKETGIWQGKALDLAWCEAGGSAESRYHDGFCFRLDLASGDLADVNQADCGTGGFLGALRDGVSFLEISKNCKNNLRPDGFEPPI